MTNRDMSRFQDSSRTGSLLVIAGTPADLGKHLLVHEAAVIGRVPEGLQLADGNISRRHAMVEARGTDHFTVADLGSTNGTLLNGEQLQEPTRLKDGDRIIVGATVLKFTLVDEDEASYHRRVEQIVSTDELTGLISKRRFDVLLEEAVRGARSSGRPLSAMMLDMDGLKAINDRHGHHVGANVIRQVGTLLKPVIEKHHGQACRWGGDEFSAFLPETSLSRARTIADEVRQVIAEARLGLGEIVVGATISIGLAMLTPELDSGQALLKSADAALYRAKAKGRNVVSD